MENKPRIVIFTTSTCPYCDLAKALLRDRGYAFEEVDLTHDPQARLSLVEKAEGRKTIPQIFLNDQPMGGYEDLKRCVEDGIL